MDELSKCEQIISLIASGMCMFSGVSRNHQYLLCLLPRLVTLSLGLFGNIEFPILKLECIQRRAVIKVR